VDEQRGERIAYTALALGTAVYTSDGELLGRVTRVMAVPEKDIFDGLVVSTSSGARFVDAPETGEIYENAVLLKIDAEEARRLPDPKGNPAVMSVGPDEAAEGSARFGITRAAKRFWGRISGNY
jgi:sporulation protein YlmC with PRC-barrel domain